MFVCVHMVVEPTHTHTVQCEIHCIKSKIHSTNAITRRIHIFIVRNVIIQCAAISFAVLLVARVCVCVCALSKSHSVVRKTVTKFQVWYITKLNSYLLCDILNRNYNDNLRNKRSENGEPAHIIQTHAARNSPRRRMCKHRSTHTHTHEQTFRYI